MILFVMIGLLVFAWLSVCFRVAITHPFATIKNAVVDIFNYFRYKKWNNCIYGLIIAFVGLFGKGKTLSAVHYVVQKYNRYNNKKVYDMQRKKWVTQKINVISNVELSIPYTTFESMAQIVSFADLIHEIDERDDTLTVTFVLGDEFSVQLNSRSFKTNIDPLFLNTLLTCRHHHISFVITSQRFFHLDALMRQVTSYVVTCNKVWRFMVHADYDAYELENANNPTDIKPLKRYGWFIRNSDFELYDTFACVQNLKKSCLAGDMLSEEEILALQQNTPSDMDAVSKPSRKYLRRKRKMR